MPWIPSKIDVFFHFAKEEVLAEILATVKRVEERQVTNMATVQEQMVELKTALDGVSTALDNIVADEAAQTQMIIDLQAQVAAGASVTPAQFQPLLDQAKAIQARTQAAADSIPDAPAGP